MAVGCVAWAGGALHGWQWQREARDTAWGCSRNGDGGRVRTWHAC